jgi:hypothetical protein
MPLLWVLQTTQVQRSRAWSHQPAQVLPGFRPGAAFSACGMTAEQHTTHSAERADWDFKRVLLAAITFWELQLAVSEGASQHRLASSGCGRSSAQDLWMHSSMAQRPQTRPKPKSAVCERSTISTVLQSHLFAVILGCIVAVPAPEHLPAVQVPTSCQQRSMQLLVQAVQQRPPLPLRSMARPACTCVCSGHSRAACSLWSSAESPAQPGRLA